jgi:hypothetical protein
MSWIGRRTPAWQGNLLGFGVFLLMLLVYPKSERTDLTVAQREALRRIVEVECP